MAKTKVRNWVARQMIIDRIGVVASATMREQPPRRCRRAKQRKNDWQREEW